MNSQTLQPCMYKRLAYKVNESLRIVKPFKQNTNETIVDFWNMLLSREQLPLASFSVLDHHFIGRNVPVSWSTLEDMFVKVYTHTQREQVSLLGFMIGFRSDTGHTVSIFPCIEAGALKWIFCNSAGKDCSYNLKVKLKKLAEMYDSVVELTILVYKS